MDADIFCLTLTICIFWARDLQTITLVLWTCMGHNSLFEKHCFRQWSVFTLVKVCGSVFLDSLGLWVIVSLSAYLVCFCAELLPWVAKGICFLTGVCWGGHMAICGRLVGTGTGLAQTIVRTAVSLVGGYEENICYLSEMDIWELRT